MALDSFTVYEQPIPPQLFTDASGTIVRRGCKNLINFMFEFNFLRRNCYWPVLLRHIEG